MIIREIEVKTVLSLCPAAGAEAFKRDLPNAVVKFVDSGHFAQESHHSEIAGSIKDFLR